jgi:hypothetical protein
MLSKLPSRLSVSNRLASSIFIQHFLKTWAVPLFLFFLSVVGFGLFIPFLGFYWDDWPLILTGKFQGISGYWPYWQFDRPFAAWTYSVSYFFLGNQPINWQIVTLLLRWATTAAMWWSLILLWPTRKQIITWAALLFCVYPVFSQQAISVAYNQHWICYFLYFLSLGLMIEAIRHPRWRWLLTGLALCASMFQLFTMEYFVGLELIRPFFLWAQITKKPGKLKEHGVTLGKLYLPYLLGLITFIAWRIFFIRLPIEDRNSPTLLFNFLAHPIQTVIRLVQMALQDISYIVITTWYTTFKPSLFDLNNYFNTGTFVLGIICAILVGVFLHSQIKGEPSEKKDSNLQQAKSVILLGLSLVIIAPLPAWITNRQVIIGAYSDRLAIPAMFGAALLIAGLVAWFIRGNRQQILVISLLIGLAVGNHLQTANDYRWARVIQNRFYWQLSWRAPEIAPDTALFGEAEILPKTGLYSTAAGINIIYANPGPSGKLPYWFFSLTREFGHQIPELVNGMALESSFRQFNFQGKSSDSLIVYYQPSEADCMRVLTAQDKNDPALSAVVRQSLPISNLSRILTKAEKENQPEEDIFGPTPERSWCYYFQKADLARQAKDWESVANLGDQAQALGFTMNSSQSNTPQEWIPFIEGYAHRHRWQEAVEITRLTLTANPKMGARLCDAWQSLAKDVPETKQQLELQGILANANCHLK